MSIAIFCVFLAALMPYIFTILAKRQGNYIRHNDAPRDYLNKLTGVHQRAYWAALNSFEAFAPFAAAVIIALFLGHVNVYTINVLSVCFIVVRVLYGICYIANFPMLRSLIWVVGIGIVIALYINIMVNM